MVAQDNPVFRQPSDPNLKIWRYMSLAKFLWLLQSDALYFCRSDMMGDPFEGHYSRPTAMSEDAFVEAQMEDDRFREWGEERHRINFRHLIDNVKHEKKTLFVNCWHMNENESFAMWKLYAAQHESICLQTTFNKLKQLLPDESFLGMVKYIDYDKDFINMGSTFYNIVHKRKSFEHERELRAVMWTANANGAKIVGETGMTIPIDVNALIENIYINPNADVVLGQVVNGLKATYRLNAQVRRSNVNDGPDY